jgi:hypothetical protein
VIDLVAEVWSGTRGIDANVVKAGTAIAWSARHLSRLDHGDRPRKVATGDSVGCGHVGCLAPDVAVSA